MLTVVERFAITGELSEYVWEHLVPVMRHPLVYDFMDPDTRMPDHCQIQVSDGDPERYVGFDIVFPVLQIPKFVPLRTDEKSVNREMVFAAWNKLPAEFVHIQECERCRWKMTFRKLMFSDKSVSPSGSLYIYNPVSLLILDPAERKTDSAAPVPDDATADGAKTPVLPDDDSDATASTPSVPYVFDVDEI